ncbi:unnamed protein product [Lactuca saligna]|uniref:Uncharacterized protein n=1 Tax=Lactuca saligna TaxID=75948 RepID=A0AA35Y986_LACSI|nr:unnamed protein product [Lactuca saligna]
MPMAADVEQPPSTSMCGGCDCRMVHLLLLFLAGVAAAVLKHFLLFPSMLIVVTVPWFGGSVVLPYPSRFPPDFVALYGWKRESFHSTTTLLLPLPMTNTKPCSFKDPGSHHSHREPPPATI